MTEREQHSGQASEPRPSDIGNSGHGSPLGYGTMRRLLLDALAETPRHGYELIRHLSESVGMGYRPSAGAIYPRLAKLTQEGLVTGHRIGRTVVYTLTDEGRAEVAKERSPVFRANDGLRSASEDPLLSEALMSVAAFSQGIANHLTNQAEHGGLRQGNVRDIQSTLADAARAITYLLDRDLRDG